jgi:predicted ribosome quality control (RQC) complex YloA/Tae2 family protein
MTKKIIALSMAAAFATSSFGSGHADMAAQLEMLKKQIAALEAKLEANSKTIKKNTKKIKKTAKKANTAKALANNDNLKWDVDFRTSVDKINYKMADGSKKANDSLLTNRLWLNTIQNCTTKDELEFYIPKKDKNQIKTKKANPYQSFFIDGYKIMLGRDERENIYLLENSKASDFWFHLQEQVSSHVIVSNRKKTIPEKIINEAASICARFSTNSGGTYAVDFTQRRNVKIQTRANVLYNPYSTVVVKI